MSQNRSLKLAMLALAGSALSAQAQVDLWSSLPHTQCNFNGAPTSLGFSSGNLGAGLEQRWSAAAFSILNASTVTEIQVKGFVPAGSEFATLNWIIFNRAAGNPAPTNADIVAQGSVPYPTPVADPLEPSGALWLHSISGLNVNLPAGNYYLTVYGAGGTNATQNFAWMANAQRNPLICPVNTPVVITNANGPFFYRATNYGASGFTPYTTPAVAVSTSPVAWGPDPQDPQYLYSHAFRIRGNGALGTGACCLPTGVCSFGSAADCCAAGGLYQGDGVTCAAANCPQPGACCLFDGSCIQALQTACTAQLGVFGGAGTACGTCTPFGFAEGATDAGDVPATAVPINGNGQPLTVIFGALDLDDVDMFRFKICNEASFQATTVGTGTAIDTMLFLFDTAGKGIVMSDDTSATVAQFSTITSLLVNANGEYYIAMSSFNNTTGIGRMPIDASAQQLFTPTNPANGQVYPEWGPTGPGAANAVAAWTGAPETTGQTYRILLQGSCFLGGTSCYADCDGVGGLTANDFACFLTAYTNGASYANCDGVGGLTANDFACFLGRYVAGCS